MSPMDKGLLALLHTTSQPCKFTMHISMSKALRSPQVERPSLMDTDSPNLADNTTLFFHPLTINALLTQ